jgi:hypothetical protein
VLRPEQAGLITGDRKFSCFLFTPVSSLQREYTNLIPHKYSGHVEGEYWGLGSACTTPKCYVTLWNHFLSLDFSFFSENKQAQKSPPGDLSWASPIAESAYYSSCDRISRAIVHPSGIIQHITYVLKEALSHVRLRFSSHQAWEEKWHNSTVSPQERSCACMWLWKLHQQYPDANLLVGLETEEGLLCTRLNKEKVNTQAT